MVIFDDLINTGLIGFFQHYRCFETTVVAVRNVVNRTADSHYGTLKAPIVLRKADETGVYKVIEDNHVVIIRNNEKYDVTGKKL